MRYAILIFDEETANPSPEPPDPAVLGQVMEEYSAYSQMLRDNGFYQGGEALQPNPTATTIRTQDGQLLVTDGPFAETKEALGGFYIVDARDLDHAIELAKACPGSKWATVEVRPVVDFSAPDAIPVGEGEGVASA